MVQEFDPEQKTACVYKPQGATPLDAVSMFKARHPEYAGSTVSYAGRLDPMAEGLLLLLIGDENRNRKHYERLPKTYEFGIMTGIATDSYDLLGIKTDVMKHCDPKKAEAALRRMIPEFVGVQTQKYPPYSAARLRGKPLYWHSRRGTLKDADIPSHRITVSRLEFEGVTHIPDLQGDIGSRVVAVRGDFRQDQIASAWKRHFAENPDFAPPVFRLSMTASGGTYVRQLVHDIGNAIGFPATVYSIKRTAVGDFTLKDAARYA